MHNEFDAVTRFIGTHLVSPDQGEMWSARMVGPATSTHEINDCALRECSPREIQPLVEMFLDSNCMGWRLVKRIQRNVQKAC